MIKTEKVYYTFEENDKRMVLTTLKNNNVSLYKFAILTDNNYTYLVDVLNGNKNISLEKLTKIYDTLELLNKGRKDND